MKKILIIAVAFLFVGCGESGRYEIVKQIELLFILLDTKTGSLEIVQMKGVDGETRLLRSPIKDISDKEYNEYKAKGDKQKSEDAIPSNPFLFDDDE